MVPIECGIDKLGVLRREHSLLEAMSRMRSDQWGVAVVVDDDERFVSTVTDFGIRHALLRQIPLDAPVGEAMSARPVVASTASSDGQILELLKTHRVRALPILDAAGAVVGMRSVDEFPSALTAPVAVIMAGGRGLRLRPVTDKTPKPLLRVGSCSIVERIIGGLTDAIATTFRAGLHLVDGLFLEGSYSQFHFPRQRDVPTDVEIFIFPATKNVPGGAGELGVPAAVGAIANAYTRATGREVTSFPIIFPVDFTPFPKGTGSTRQSPR